MSLSKDLGHENIPEEKSHGNEDGLDARFRYETGVVTVDSKGIEDKEM